MWLTKIDVRLPAFVGHIYAHDLQSKSLKDIQPQLAASMDSLLTDLAVQDEVKVNYSRTRHPSQQGSSTFNNRNRSNARSKNVSFNPKPTTQKRCLICKSAGRNPSSHNTPDCWFVSKFEKLQLSKALRVETDDLADEIFDDEDEVSHSVEYVETSQSDTGDEVDTVVDGKSTLTEVTCNRVDCDVSPFFYAFYNHLPVHITVDCGATSSLI